VLENGQRFQQTAIIEKWKNNHQLSSRKFGAPEVIQVVQFNFKAKRKSNLMGTRGPLRVGEKPISLHFQNIFSLKPFFLSWSLNLLWKTNYFIKYFACRIASLSTE